YDAPGATGKRNRLAGGPVAALEELGDGLVDNLRGDALELEIPERAAALDLERTQRIERANIVRPAPFRDLESERIGALGDLDKPEVGAPARMMLQRLGSG